MCRGSFRPRIHIIIFLNCVIVYQQLTFNEFGGAFIYKIHFEIEQFTEFLKLLGPRKTSTKFWLSNNIK